MSAYAEKLKDPRWQKKRLQILERDHWCCQECASTIKTLHVHHLHYEAGRDPWDYPEFYLRTLCVDCHKSYEDSKPENEQSLLRLYHLFFKNELERYCLEDLMRYRDSANVAWLISQLGVREAEDILRNAFWEMVDATAAARANRLDDQPPHTL